MSIAAAMFPPQEGRSRKVCCTHVCRQPELRLRLCKREPHTAAFLVFCLLYSSVQRHTYRRFFWLRHRMVGAPLPLPTLVSASPRSPSLFERHGSVLLALERGALPLDAKRCFCPPRCLFLALSVAAAARPLGCPHGERRLRWKGGRRVPTRAPRGPGAGARRLWHGRCARWGDKFEAVGQLCRHRLVWALSAGKGC